MSNDITTKKNPTDIRPVHCHRDDELMGIALGLAELQYAAAAKRFAAGGDVGSAKSEAYHAERCRVMGEDIAQRIRTRLGLG